MKKALFALALALPGMANAGVLSGTFQTAPGDSGNFLHVEIGPCSSNASLTCGTIVRKYNADGSLDSAYENLGKPIIWDMVDQGNGHWGKGKIWAPDRDKTYNSKMTLNGNKLKVEGCVLIFCRSQTWQMLP